MTPSGITSIGYTVHNIDLSLSYSLSLSKKLQLSLIRLSNGLDDLSASSRLYSRQQPCAGLLLLCQLSEYSTRCSTSCSARRLVLCKIEFHISQSFEFSSLESGLAGWSKKSASGFSRCFGRLSTGWLQRSECADARHLFRYGSILLSSSSLQHSTHSFALLFTASFLSVFISPDLNSIKILLRRALLSR